MKHVRLFEEFNSPKPLNIGDNTNMGIIKDVTDTQFFINGVWYHKSLVKPGDEVKKEPLKNRGRISPGRVISAFANEINDSKIEEYADIMTREGLLHTFPPIKGFPIIINEDDVERFGAFLSGVELKSSDIGEYAWVTTDGHHRVLAAIEANLPYLETKLDPVYLGDARDYTE